MTTFDYFEILLYFSNISKLIKSVFDAWKRIIGEEGITALWTGCGPTIGRAMVVNVCQLCCQTQAKEEIAKRTSGKNFKKRILKVGKMDGQRFESGEQF